MPLWKVPSSDRLVTHSTVAPRDAGGLQLYGLPWFWAMGFGSDGGWARGPLAHWSNLEALTKEARPEKKTWNSDEQTVCNTHPPTTPLAKNFLSFIAPARGSRTSFAPPLKFNSTVRTTQLSWFPEPQPPPPHPTCTSLPLFYILDWPSPTAGPRFRFPQVPTFPLYPQLLTLPQFRHPRFSAPYLLPFSTPLLYPGPRAPLTTFSGSCR
ncbi:uncharacterized protein LOC111813538 [Octodon degus]|uniref:Uncharacterized protein LOC111813538 n=1 Tax=Octodon degus TaxID=10160 RepID=A0A6P6DJW2_OCTDE|nr:uncharacterized protein LOC111813538 [Octodon degus]